MILASEDPCDESGGPTHHQHRPDLGPDFCVRSFIEKAFLDIRITHIAKMSSDGAVPRIPQPYVLHVTSGSTVGHATSCQSTLPKGDCEIIIRKQKDQFRKATRRSMPDFYDRNSGTFGGGYYMRVDATDYKDCGSCWSELSHELGIALKQRCPRVEPKFKTLRGVSYSIYVNPGHYLWPPTIPTGGFGPAPKPIAIFELIYAMTVHLHNMLTPIGPVWKAGSSIFNDVGVDGGIAQKALKNIKDCEVTFGTKG